MTVETVAKPQRAKPPHDAAPHVIRAINAVTAELAGEGIGKTRQNEQQKFKFRGIDDVLNALARIIADSRLVIIPHVLSRDLTERHAKSGGVLFCVTVRVEYTFVSADDGSRETVGPFDGEAMDSGDKATNKAMSAAYKYMALQTFCIPTEGDNDADATTHEVAAGERSSPQPISSEELAELQKRIAATGTDIALFCGYLRVGALADLRSPSGYDRAIAALDAKAKKSAKQEPPHDSAK